MHQLDNNLLIINKDIDLLYSPEELTWYFQKHLHDEHFNTRNSQTFRTQDDALQALRQNRVTWR